MLSALRALRVRVVSRIADLIVARLRAAGVRALFGVPGGGSNLDLIEAAGHAGLPFVLTATETAAAIAAQAQAEITGAPGACLTTIGPGVTSVVNGVASARLDRAPLVVITDSAPSNAAFGHQRLDHRAVLAPVTKWSATIDAHGAMATIDRALACAVAPPAGPVHLDLPADVAAATAPDMTSALDARDDVGGAAAQGFDSVESLLTRARRPLLIAGLGARCPRDVAAIRAFVARHAIPAMVTYKAKGVVPDRDAHFAGVFTNGAVEREIVEQADLLVGIGLDPIELLPRPWSFGAPIVYCGRWTVDARHVPFAAQEIGDPSAALDRVSDRLSHSEWDLEAVQRTLRRQADRLRFAGDQLTPDSVVRLASTVFSSARVVVDAGAHMFPATTLWPVAEANGMLISNGLSTMGFAVPAAIGAALLAANTAGPTPTKGDPVVVLTGDGGLLMCAGELLTVVRERLRVVVIVFSDASLSLIDVKQRQRRYAPAGVALGDVAWAAAAESFRMSAHAATTEAELDAALSAAARHPGPTLIDARIDPGTYADTLRMIRG